MTILFLLYMIVSLVLTKIVLQQFLKTKSKIIASNFQVQDFYFVLSTVLTVP